MEDILCESIWEQLAKASKGSKSRTAAIAYFATEKFVRFREGDFLVVDASDQAITTRQTSRTLLRKLVRRGVRVFSLPKLHGKMIAFEDCAFIGSMNFSNTSPMLTEVALRVTRKSLVTEAKSVVRSLAARGDEVDQVFIRRLMKLKLIPKQGGLGGRKRTNRPVQVWLVSTNDLPDALVEKEAAVTARGEAKAASSANYDGEISWTRFAIRREVEPRLRFLRQAKRGDRVIEIYTSPEGVTTVYRYGYVRHFQRGKNWRRVYFEWSDYSEKTWKGFAKVWDKAGGGPISPKSSRLVNDVVAKKLLAYW
jgi:hypothetical protein